MGADCLAHVFWGVLDDICSYFRNPPPHFPPDHSCLVTQLITRPLPVCVAPSFQTLFSGTKNKSTALGLQCRTTLEEADL